MTGLSKYIMSILIIASLGMFYSVVNSNAEEANNRSQWLLEKTVTTHSTGYTNIIQYFYDEKDRRQKMVLSSQGPGVQGTTTIEYFYDSVGNQTKQVTTTIAGGNKVETTKTMLYDSNNFLKTETTVTVQNGIVSTTTAEYENDVRGKPIKTIRKHSNNAISITLSEWDDCGRLTKSIISNSVMEYKYVYVPGEKCRPLSLTSYTNNQSIVKNEYEYTSTGKQSKITRKFLSPNIPASQGNTSTFAYDENDNIKETQTLSNAGKVLSTSKHTYRKRSASN